MSLPQRKKSAEEIAKLRESLGIPGHPPGEGPPPADPIPSAPPEPAVKEPAVAAVPAEDEKPAADEPSGEDEVSEPGEITLLTDEDADDEEEPIVLSAAPSAEESSPSKPQPALEPLPAGEIAAPRQVRSLRRSERMPVLPIGEESPGTIAPREGSTIPGKTVLPAMQVPRQARSLRKSEQGPVEVHEPRADSKLPHHRHSDKELGEIRRREAIAQVNNHAPPKPMVAHLAIVIPGYIAAIIGGVGFHYYDFAIQATATCVGIALLVAAFIFIKRPLSRHHAAFISVMTLFVIVFGALYYFPQLQHGT